VGLTEEEGREAHDVVTAVVHFDSTCAPSLTAHVRLLQIESPTARRVESSAPHRRRAGRDIMQVAAVAMAAGMRVDELARVALSFPTYAGFCRVRRSAGPSTQLTLGWQAHQAESTRQHSRSDELLPF